jgi:hypothetical protein
MSVCQQAKRARRKAQLDPRYAKARNKDAIARARKHALADMRAKELIQRKGKKS